jgi:hypothetical protein
MSLPAEAKARPTRRIYIFLAIAGALSIFLLGSLERISDPDLWWHLKSGERIVAEGALPQEDSFAFTSELFSTPREQSILRGYPISQILLFSAYQVGGFHGVMGLRLLILFTLAFILIRQTRSRRANVTIAALVFSLGMFAFFNAHSLDRPHIYSFLFFPVLIGLMRPTGKESWLILPLMTLWANCHGGFIIGLSLLPIYVIGRFLDVGPGQELKHSILWVSGGALATFFNPNGWSFFTQIIEGTGSVSISNIREYSNIFEAFALGEQWVLAVWALSILALISQLGQARRYWSEALPLGATCFLSFYMIRATGFFALGMLPLIAGALSKHYAKLNMTSRQIVSLASILLILFTATQQAQTFATNRQQIFPENDMFYPHSASEFLQKTRIKGHMYNAYDWGGFFIWKLYPQYQVFIDGRTLDDELFSDSRKISRGSTQPLGGGDEYEVLLAKYNIEFVVIPLQQKNGTFSPLFGSLLGNPRWALIYQDDRAIIFIKKNGPNNHLLKSHQIDERASVQSLVQKLRQRVDLQPEILYNYFGYANALLYANQLPEAHRVLTAASKLAPNNAALIQFRTLIEKEIQERAKRSRQPG